ncbi:MAG: hypothetical protein LBG95_01635 [Treponema sp.]|jgi:predicted RNA-binding Zn-ribbon protein involved in translation (DUF1610 family)|nr:hypothetical protein [Treponema sp.]
MVSKKPRFFCDNCGAEVGRNAKACPHCGRFFAAVRCPSCGFTGEEKTFMQGCPSCGYSAPQSGNYQFGQKFPAAPLVPAGKLPLWVYILSICAFIGICAALILTLRSP